MARSRRPDADDDPGYEVVDDPGYEVVDEPAPARRARVVGATPGPKKRAVVAVSEEDRDDTTSSRREDTVERLRKKKKRQTIADLDDDAPPRNTAWWVLPVLLIVVGLSLSLVGAVGCAAKTKNAAQAVGTGVVLAVTLVQFVVSIPVSIVALVASGKLFGIEYGSPLMAIANIAAIGAMMMGLDWALTWVGMWPSAVHIITFITGFSLFLTLFQLDSWEVWVSIICIKVVTFFSYLLVFLLVLASVVRGGGGGFDDFGPDEDDDDRPKARQKKDHNAKGDPPPDRRDWDPDDDN